MFYTHYTTVIWITGLDNGIWVCKFCNKYLSLTLIYLPYKEFLKYLECVKEKLFVIGVGGVSVSGTLERFVDVFHDVKCKKKSHFWGMFFGWTLDELPWF